MTNSIAHLSSLQEGRGKRGRGAGYLAKLNTWSDLQLSWCACLNLHGLVRTCRLYVCASRTLKRNQDATYEKEIREKKTTTRTYAMPGELCKLQFEWSLLDITHTPGVAAGAIHIEYSLASWGELSSACCLLQRKQIKVKWPPLCQLQSQLQLPLPLQAHPFPVRCAACCCWHSCSVSYPSACFNSWLCCVFKFCCKSLEAIAKRQQATHTLIQCEGARGQGMGHCLIWLSSAESECWQHPWLTCVGLSLFNDLPLPLPFVLPFFFFFLFFLMALGMLVARITV